MSHYKQVSNTSMPHLLAYQEQCKRLVGRGAWPQNYGSNQSDIRKAITVVSVTLQRVNEASIMFAPFIVCTGVTHSLVSLTLGKLSKYII